MTARERNLLIAARFLRRADEALEGAMEIEGVLASEIAADIEQAVISARAAWLLDDSLGSRNVNAEPNVEVTVPGSRIFQVFEGGAA